MPMKLGWRRLANGSFGRPKRPNAAASARSTKVRHLLVDKSRRLLRDGFDRRTKVWREYRRRVDVLRAHVGGEITAPMERVIDLAVRHSLLTDLAWGRIASEGATLEDGPLSKASEMLVRTAKAELELLKIVGVERRALVVDDLQDYLEAKAAAKEESDEQAQA